jgi:uncharacterized membrane protein
MKPWTQAVQDAVISGTCAALGSTAALTLCGAIERRNGVAPNNGPSGWLWGETEAYRRRATLRHTLPGYLIHHAMSISWAMVYERWIAASPGRSPRVIVVRGALTAALACFVDYRVTPRRFRPGFEKHLGRLSLAVMYTAFAMGLALPELVRPTPRSSRAARMTGPARQLLTPRSHEPTLRRRAMEQVEKIVEVGCPIHTVYNQWTQFEEFPRFMPGVKEVRQMDDTHVHWHAEVWGKDEEWDAEITEQEPDERISWKSISGAPNTGTVRFEALGPDRTRVRLVMAYEPQGAIENAGDAVGALSSRVQSTIESFKQFIEARGQETGGWRGEVDDGSVK